MIIAMVASWPLYALCPNNSVTNNPKKIEVTAVSRMLVIKAASSFTPKTENVGRDSRVKRGVLGTEVVSSMNRVCHFWDINSQFPVAAVAVIFAVSCNHLASSPIPGRVLSLTTQ